MDPGQRRSKIEKVRIDSLRVPPAGKAQRPFRSPRATSSPPSSTSTASDFRWSAASTASLARRWSASRLRHSESGYAESTVEIECELYEGLTMAEMARMFLGAQPQHPRQRFQALRSRGDRRLSNRVGHHRDRCQSRSEDLGEYGLEALVIDRGRGLVVAAPLH